MKPEVHRVPDAVELDRAIRKLHRRIQAMETQYQQALRRGGLGWVQDIVGVTQELTVAVQQLTQLMSAFRNLKARVSK